MDAEQPLLNTTAPAANESSPLMGQGAGGAGSASSKQTALQKFQKRRFLFFSFGPFEEGSSSPDDYYHQERYHQDHDNNVPRAAGAAAAAGPPPPPVWDRFWWRTTHALGFVSGGLLFLLGTLLYYPQIYFAAREEEEDDEDGTSKSAIVVDALAVIIGWLYIIGSCGFLYVDVQEFWTFTKDPELRINIACSAFGSTLYVIGSAGFLPSIWARSPLVGLLGFIGGSAAIGCSQAWKLYRILSTSASSSSSTPRNAVDTINAACVEGGAMVGGFCFLIGTCFFWSGPVLGDEGCTASCFNYQRILFLWVIGSLTFSFGGLSLAYRHAVLKIT